MNTMNADYGLSDSLLNRPDPGAYNVGQFNWASASYAKSENADITIITDDGDRVTISTDRSLEANYASYSGLLRSGTSSLKAEAYEYQTQVRSNLSLSIAGELDSKEYEDIISAVKTIESVMADAFSGKIDIQSFAEKFKELDSLSALSASIKVEESMNYRQGQAIVSGSSDTPDGDKKDIKDTEKADHALDKIVNTGMKHGKVNGEVRRLMDDYLSELLNMFSRNSETDNPGLKAGEKMKEMIMGRFDKKEHMETPS